MSTSTNKTKRPPVVVVMGHVDHGKTTLLDYIRKANVAAKEAGGITQAVGAYEITHNNERITFIDTPGHEAFTKMRSRGAQIADIAILVVAADDGVNVQTKEAIKIIQDSGIPYVVAINKIDKNNADIENAKRSLVSAGVLIEGMGGSISFQPLSAKTGEGVGDLLDLLALTAEVESLTCDPTAPAEGYILEAHVDRGGVTATAIIKNGTLRQGDELATPSAGGRVKGLKDFAGKTVKELSPCSPAVILGFDQLPAVGDAFAAGEKIKDIQKISAAQQQRAAVTAVEGKEKVSVILKASVSGALEALTDAVKKLRMPDNRYLVIVETSVGDITDGDVKNAASTGALIIGFKVKATAAAKTLITAQEVKVYQSDIIYELLEALEKRFSGEQQKIVTGDLEILAVFDQKNNGAQIVGGKVTLGEVKNQTTVEILRRGSPAGTGKITNLQQARKDTASVPAGNECGLLFSSSTLLAKGDHLISHPE